MFIIQFKWKNAHKDMNVLSCFFSGYTKESSSIIVIGINFRTTPVEIREKLSIPEAQWHQAISDLCDLNHIDEAAVLSTCNRMEVYVLALSRHRGVKEVTEWMSKVQPTLLHFACYFLPPFCMCHADLMICLLSLPSEI